MSTLRVNKIVNLNNDGPIEFTKGVTVPSGQKITDGTGNEKIVINSVGVVTATSFVGSGENVTSIPGNGIPKGKALALSLIL